MDRTASVVIAEDHPFFRDGVRRALDKAPAVRVVGEADNGQTALEQIRALKPDVAIVDIGLPQMDGVTLLRRIREERLPVEVVLLTICEDQEVFEEALDLGVKGYLLKDCTDAELRRCIEAVLSGRHYLSPAMTSYVVGKTRQIERFVRATPGLDRLTPQERGVLRRIAAGQSSKEIAATMGLAPRTIDSHRASICSKLELHGTYALSRFVARHRDQI